MYKLLRDPISYLLLLAILIGASGIRANPKTRTYRVAPDVLLKAAKKAAAGHAIVRFSDASSQVFSDNTQDTLGLAFVTKIEGFAPAVVAVINITQRKDGYVDLEVFYRRKETGSVRTPSTEFLARKTAYETELQKTLNHIDEQRDLLEKLWQLGGIDRTDYYAKRRSLDAAEYNARVSTLNLVHKAKMEDLAQMPRSTFAAMDEAAHNYFQLVDENLDLEKVNH